MQEKGSAFQCKYNRLKPQIGHKRAMVAVAHSLVKAIYYVLATREAYPETTPEAMTDIQGQRMIRRHTRRLRRMGCWLQEWYVTRCRTKRAAVESPKLFSEQRE